MKHILASLTAAFVAVLALAQPSHAVAADTPVVAVWDTTVIKVYAAPLHKRGWKVNRTVIAWNVALNPIGVTLKTVGTPCSGCITLHEEAVIPESEPYIGIARWQFDSTVTRFTQCDIAVEPSTSRPYRAGLIAHEVGHCLGLNHSERLDSIMYWAVNGQAVPNAVDLAWLAGSYSTARAALTATP